MIVGIDLGTTNSLIAVFRDSGPELIPNALGSFLTPSAVHMDETKQASVGQSAKDRLMTSPGASAARFKRLMGTNQWTALRQSKFRPEDLSAFVLKALRADAEAFLDEPVEEAVISVPAYFNDVQRNATIAAAKIAGLKVKRLINEPTAAALAYGLHDRDGEDTFLVIDIGGGTFDVSILEMFDGVMEVRACAGDAFLGGEDFTDRIVDDFAAQLAISTADMDPASHARLRSIADQAKHLLGENTVAKLPFVTGNREVTLKISRSHLEDICGDLINRMRLPIQRAISDANLKASEINRIILVGGASRMLLVRTLVTRLFQRFPEHDIDPDHVVALGTAVQAGLSERHKALEEIVMTDVCPFTLGYETARQIGPNKEMEYGVFSPLVERNTTVPVSRSQIVTPLTLGQTLIELNIFQGEAPYVTDNIRIGSLNVSIPRNHNDLEKVDIRFTYDNSGVLEVIAKVLSNNHEKRIIIEGNPGALSSREIEQRLKALEHIKVHPRDELVNEAMLARLSSLYENLLGDQRASVSNLIGQFEGVLARQDKREIEQTRKSILTHVVQLEQGHKFD